MNIRIPTLSFAILGLVASAWVPCWAKGVHSPPVMLRDVRVIDGNGGPPLEHADILITGSKITAIQAEPDGQPDGQPDGRNGNHTAGPHDAQPDSRNGNRGAGQDASQHDAQPVTHNAIKAPPNTTIIKLTGKTVLPGLISNHSHVGLVKGTTASGNNITRANILRQLKQYTAYGVTTVTSLGLNLEPFYGVQPQAHSGATRTADLFGADKGFGAPNGAPPASIDIQVYRPSTPEEARSQVRETAQRHPDLLKIWVDDMHGRFAAKMNPEVYKAVIDEAHVNGLRVAAHVYYLDDAKQLVGDGIDILAHGVRDKAVDSDFTEAIKRRGAWYVPTLGVDESFYIYAEHPEWLQQPFFRRSLQPSLAAQLNDTAWRAQVLADTKTLAFEKQALATNMKNVKALFDAGVNIGFGSDSGATPLRIAGFAEHRELKLLTDAGLTPLQAIQTATKNAAALLHLDDRGIIAPGKLADLLIVDGDPSKDISALDNIESVWRRGKKVADARWFKPRRPRKPA
jgi:imidazolonepropionase-like amidohydrolase